MECYIFKIEEYTCTCATANMSPECAYHQEI